MAGIQGQVWVTSVVKEQDVRNALLLSAYLRQVYTLRKIAVITSPEISSDLRKALHYGFDFVFYLDNDQNTIGLDSSDFVKMYSLLALQGFVTCVYLSPKMVTLKNCDELFSQHANEFTLLEGTTANTSAFVFNPSRHTFEVLMAELGSGKSGTGLYKLFKTWSTKHKNKSDNLKGKYNVVISNGKGNGLMRFENDISIVNFEGCTDESDFLNLEENVGLLGKLIAAHYHKLQGQVQSWLNSCTISPVKSLLVDHMRKCAYKREPIAIVGMSCRLPSCNNLEEFWQLLFQDEDGTSTVPTFRWRKEECSKYVPEAGKIRAGFLKCRVDEFDAQFFGISPKEALFMDPQQRLLHELVWEGLEDACIDPRSLYGTPGSVFVGSWLNDYKHILEHSGNDEFYRSYMGNSIGATAARISFLLGLTGPSIGTESGCSSAMVAVHLACKSLNNRETNVALACGVNLMLNPVDQNNLPLMVSPDGHSKTFSEDADGFGRAEGGGVLVLKRLSDALASGDRIWGLIRGTAISQEGISKSMGTPTVHCESLAMEQALLDANVNAHQVSYLEAHGTGTVVGDPLEVRAIARAYNSPHRHEPLIISSVKTNVGHTESCSGITGIIKVILAMHHEIIPAHINFSKLNPSIDLDAIPAVIPMERMQWKKIENEPRIAGVSSFGITGTDAHVILEEPPTGMCTKMLTLDDDEMERPLHIMKLSTKSEEAMSLLLDDYKSLAASSEDSITDIAYSANTGRADFEMRTVVIAKNKADICSAIEQRKFLKGEANSEKVGKLCFLFTGQGSQYPGMAKQLFETSPIFRIHFEYCEKILREMYSINITNVLWSDEASSSSKGINRTIYSQTSIFCVEYALMKLWESWGVKPNYVLGHSLGEFAAAVCAGILSVEDAIKLVAERSKLIDELPHGTMLVIRANKLQIDETMRDFSDGGRKSKLLDYAALNSNHQTVVAGDSDLVMEFSKHCTERGLKCVVLDATHAFHSRHMDPILQKYKKVVKAVSIKQSGQKCGYISGMTGDLVTIEQMDTEYWVHHTREKVNFLRASKKAVELGCRTFIEIGPQPILSALTMMNNENVNLACISSLRRNTDDWSTLLTSLATLYVKGVNIAWNGLDQFYARKKVRLPHYPFIRKKFWPKMIMQNSSSSTQSRNAIHPLLGRSIPNATPVTLFQSEVSLLSLEYMTDHCIGDQVIFPAAAYLEMCLLAGAVTVLGSNLDSFTKPHLPVKVENLTVTTPLALDQFKTCQLQTVVESSSREACGNANIKIFHRVDNSNALASWLEHAHANFSPQYAAVQEHYTPFHAQKKIHEYLIQKLWNGEMVEHFYEELKSVGLNFGPKFKSLESVCYDKEKNFLFLKLKPFMDPSVSQYICHPVVLDAMIQAAMMMNQQNDSVKKTLYVPIKIGSFVWLSDKPSAFNKTPFKDMFIHAFYDNAKNEYLSTSSRGGYCTVALLDFRGNSIAVMSEIEFIDTTANAIESVLEQQASPMPNLWEEVWQLQNAGPEPIPSSGSTKMWLVFCGEDKGGISADLAKHIRHFTPDRKVVTIRRCSKFGELEPSFHGIRQHCQEDYFQLMEIIDAVGKEVEGIIYCWSLDETYTKQEDILQPYFFLVKSLDHLNSQKSPPKLVTLLGTNLPFANTTNFPGVCTSTLRGFIKSLENENLELRLKCIDVNLQNVEGDTALQIFYELWRNDDDSQVAFYENGRYVPKFIPLQQDLATMEIPLELHRFKLVLPSSKAIADLQFGPLDPVALKPEQIEIQVKVYALNFRDLMSVLKPSDDFKDINAVGLDFSGVVVGIGSQVKKWTVGDIVFGLNMKHAFPSHITTHQDNVISVPKDVTFSEAVTLPTVFATNYQCLVELGKLTASDSVLIHAASGGVGLNAIDICRCIGATIFATAGSSRKQNYLRSLGIQHVFNSRNTEYEKKILKATNGRGVDLVLNSLTGPGFKEATLNACAQNARFFELSKMSIWKPEHVQKLRPDVKYTIIDVSKMNTLENRRLLNILEEYLLQKAINPLPFVRFDAINLQESMYYLQKAKHIGKVVCAMPELGRQEDGKRLIHTPLFHSNATYLITGGVGGIGMEVRKWMISMGAKYILLASRHPPTSKASSTISDINEKFGANVNYVPLDVSSFQQCQHLINVKISEMGYPTLRGVMHAAGSLRDGLVENQTWETFSEPLAAKIDGTINLHELTKNNQKMEHFVLFSSIATSFGYPGQSNYSSANHFQDVFAHYRNSIGLPATSINWGQWGQVGLATDANLPGIRPLSILQAIRGLEYALKSHRPQTAVVNIKSFSSLAKPCPRISNYIDEMTWKIRTKSNNVSSVKSSHNLEDFWQQYNSLQGSAEKKEMLKDRVCSVLREVLKLDGADSIDDNMNFLRMGVDSLMFVEISNCLRISFSDRVVVSTSAIRESGNVQLLSEVLMKLIEGDANIAVEDLPTFEQVNTLIKEDCFLPNFIRAKENQNAIAVNKVSCVLVTGSTGTLGPYILKELSSQPQITEILCLVLPRNKTSGIERLKNVFLERDLQAVIDMKKIKCVDGNVSSPKLGMQSGIWESLCERVDAVVHCAASVRHVEHYNKRNKNADSMRSVNIHGTKNILEFSCSGTKLKHVFHASSYMAVAKTTEQGHLSEDWPEPDDYNGVTTLAYPITKFVGDVLMKKAILDRGIPGKVFRFPIIIGDSKTGRFVLDSNHVMQRYLFILEHGIIQKNAFPTPIVPVDICACASIQLFLNPDVPNDIYNVIDSPPFVDQEFVGIAEKLGYKIDVVEYSKFAQKVHQSTVQDSQFAMFKEFYSGEDFMATAGIMAWLPHWASLRDAEKQDFMTTKKIKKYLPEFHKDRNSAAERLYKDILFAMEQGWIKKKKLATQSFNVPM